MSAHQIQLRKKFVKDTSLPIPVLESPHFEHFLDLYEEHFRSKTQYALFEQTELEKSHKSDQASSNSDAKHLAQKVRFVLENTEAYRTHFPVPLKSGANRELCTENGKQLNSAYELRPSMKIACRDTIYSREYVGKTLVSVDISSGNFASLRYHDTRLVLGCDSFGDLVTKVARLNLEELMGEGVVVDSSTSDENDTAGVATLDHDMRQVLNNTEFSDQVIHYVTSNKMLRQVIFGQMNPKTQIMIQKFLIGLVIESLVEHGGIDRKQIVSSTSDEVLFLCRDSTRALDDYTTTRNVIQQHLPQIANRLKVEVFELKVIDNEKTGKVAGYVKEFLFDSHSKGQKFEIKSIPGYLFAQAYKKYLGLPIEENDLVFTYEGMVASFKNPFF